LLDRKAFYGNIYSGESIYMIIDLNVKGKQVLVVGGGNESARKVEALLTQQCNIIVVADKVEKSIKQHADAGKIILELRKIENVDFINKYHKLFLILATTDNRKLNREIVLFGKSHGYYVYAADDPEVSDFSHPSIINIGDTIQVAISTGGKSPLMGKTLREQVEPIIKNSISDLILNQIKLQEQLRIEAQRILPSPEHRKSFLIELMHDDEVNQFLEEKKISEANTIAYERLNRYLLRVSNIEEKLDKG